MCVRGRRRAVRSRLLKVKEARAGCDERGTLSFGGADGVSLGRSQSRSWLLPSGPGRSWVVQPLPEQLAHLQQGKKWLRSPQFCAHEVLPSGSW